jgi:hypothetical protein
MSMSGRSQGTLAITDFPVADEVFDQDSCEISLNRALSEMIL